MIIVIGVILLLTALTVTVITGLTERSEIRETETTMQLMEQALSEWELASGRQVTFGRSVNFDGISNNEPNCPGGPEPRYELPQLIEAGDDAMEDDALIASDMLWTILSRTSSSREIIARINPDYLIELDPNATTDPPVHFDVNDLDHLEDHMNGRIGYRFLDAWDNPIIAVMPGRRFTTLCPDGSTHSESMLNYADEPDNDGTIRTPFENRFGIASSRRIFFVSAGPSGRFGNLHLDIAAGALSANEREDIRRAADNIYSHEIILEEGRPQP